MNHKKRYDVKLDEEERKLSRSLDRDEWKTIPHIKSEKKKVQKAADHYFRKAKEQRICVRVFSHDLERLKAIAENEGLPYQTLVTSVLHKYVSGRYQEINATLRT